MAKYDDAWMEAWKNKVNADPVTARLAKFMTVNFGLSYGEERKYVIKVYEGKVMEIVNLEGKNAQNFPHEFSLDATKEAWDKFVLDPAPPLFHDLWAMAHPLHRHMVINGNTHAFWQNIRALCWMFDLVRAI
jgi:hypothetical protein